MGRNLALRRDADGESVVLWASGELDLASRQFLIDAVVDVVSARQPVVVDLSALTFLDSSGIGALAKCRNAAVRLGCRFQVRGATGQVARVLAITGVLTLLTDPDS